MNYIKNPILKGFNPDPSIIRVGKDYYIATSTFEWFPGVQIHHSRDLINWQLIARPLNRVSQLDMRGNPDSLGVWAPCLTHSDGIFYLVYSNVKNIKGGIMDVHNYLVISTDICDNWSEPIFLNSSGFDPSLFHDDDGRKWLVNTSCDSGKDKSWFGGIILQEYSLNQRKLIGPIYKIFEGTELGYTEGPHLYKRNGFYYLITAEGGTGLNHAVTLARSKNLIGPYEVAPNNPIITAKYDPKNPLQKTGHADFTETPQGDIYMVHLCGRPIPRRGVCTLGRETCIQKMVWTEDGWLQLENGGNSPLEIVPAPADLLETFDTLPSRDDFDSCQLNIHFQTLRMPLGEDIMTLKERPGYLRLYGMESLNSLFNQSLVARRQQSFSYSAITCLEFEPESFKQAAGLVCYYNTENYHYLWVSHDEKLGKTIGITTCCNYKLSYPLHQAISIDGWEKCYLMVKVNYNLLSFYYSRDGQVSVK